MVVAPRATECPHDQGPLQEVAELPQGAVFDGYRVVRRLGVGGMGKVYEAEHLSLGRKVALKVLLPRYARDHEAIRRFLSEAKAVNLINHQNIVNIYDISTAPSGDFYFVMELLEGQDLSKFLQLKAPLPERVAVRIFGQIARALWAAHQKGIIHRDLKPANVFLISREGNDSFVKLLDFGLAKLQGEPQDNQKGPLLGTPHYMAPEYIRGAEPSPQTDQYAFGVLMYRGLTGVRPFEGQDPMEVFKKQLNEPAKDPQLVIPTLRTELAQLVMRTLEKDPTRRFPSMGTLLESLDSLLATTQEPEEESQVKAPPRPGAKRYMPLLLLGLVALLAGGGWLVYSLLSGGASMEVSEKSCLGVLRASLQEAPPKEKKLALQKLGELAPKEATELLSPFLQEQDLEVRQSAILALGKTRDPAAKELLLPLSKNSKSLDVAAALFWLGEEPAKETLRAALNEPSRRINAALALAQGGDINGVGVLREALDRSLLSPSLSVEAAAALLYVGDPTGKEALLRLMKEAPEVAPEAALELAKQSEAEGLDWLVANKNTPKVAIALGSLGDERGWPLLWEAAQKPAQRGEAIFAIAAYLKNTKGTKLSPSQDALLVQLLSDNEVLTRIGAALSLLQTL